MADQKKIAGVSSFTVASDAGPAVSFKVGDSASYRISGVDRETLMGANGFAGYKEMPVPGFIEVAIFDQRDLDFTQMRNWSNVTATLVTASGKIIVCTGHLVTTPEPSATDGTATLRFEGETQEVFVG
jgi:hypothetical protein